MPFAPAVIPELDAASASSTLLVVYLGARPTAVVFTTWAFALSHSTMARQKGATAYLAPRPVITLSWLTLRAVPAAIELLGGAPWLAGCLPPVAVRLALCEQRLFLVRRPFEPAS